MEVVKSEVVIPETNKITTKKLYQFIKVTNDLV